MDKIIRDAGSISYSDKDIYNLLEGDVVILTYPALGQCLSQKPTAIIEDIFKIGLKAGQRPPCCACILYMTKPNFGHWTAVLRNTGGIENYEIFDSYGMFPDDELNYISENFKIDSDQSDKHLSNIVSNNLKQYPNVPIYYNKYKLQSAPKGDIKAINTCGRWCGIRCLLRRFSLNEFISLFIDQTLSPDMIVTYLTILNR